MLTANPSPLRLARLSTGLTQIVIAQRARISAARLSLLERCYVQPDARERTALAAALGLAEADLFPSSARESTPSSSALTPSTRSTQWGEP